MSLVKVKSRRHSLVLPKNPQEPLRAAVKRHCLDCNGAHFDLHRNLFHRPEEECSVLACPLYPYYVGVTKWNNPAKWGQWLKKWEERQRELW
jgi:hypothetical protein